MSNLLANLIQKPQRIGKRRGHRALDRLPDRVQEVQDSARREKIEEIKDLLRDIKCAIDALRVHPLFAGYEVEVVTGQIYLDRTLYETLVRFRGNMEADIVRKLTLLHLWGTIYIDKAEGRLVRYTGSDDYPASYRVIEPVSRSLYNQHIVSRILVKFGTM